MSSPQSKSLQDIAKERLEKAKTKDYFAIRKASIDLLESGEGAKLFVEDLRQYGVTERGEPLVIRPWFAEYARLIADMRIGVTYTSGAAQTGKTLAHTLLICWLSANRKLNTIWAYAQERTLNRCVPLQFKPTIEAWLKRNGITPDKGSRNNLVYMVPGGTNIFTYVSTSASSENKSGGASAGSSVVSVSADVAFLEERSQYPSGADAPVERRLDASRLSRHPIRQLGTPGHGKGIEEEIEKADYHFFPHVVCSGCGERIALNPKGTLLKPHTEELPTGEKKISFLSPSGTPLNWFFHDPNNQEKTAYFGCPHCETEITKEQRLDARFYCIKTKVGLTELLDDLPDTGNRLKIGIIISPLLRDTKYNLAAELIRGGLETTNPDDWQQQRLGLPSETGNTSVTLEMVERAIRSPAPEKGKKVIRLAGVDQGRAEYWLIIADYILPDNYLTMSVQEIINQSVRVVHFGSGVSKTAINDILDNYQVEYGLIDNEPTRDAYLEYPKLDMADQKDKLKDSIKATTVVDGGVEYPAWDIRNDKFLTSVLNCFSIIDSEGYPLARLPESWTKWTRIQTERSPVRHLISMRYDPETGKWERPEDHCDHLYHAFAFMEAAFHIKLDGLVVDFSWMSA